MEKLLIIFSVLFCSSCELIPNHKPSDKEPGFSKLPCENILESKVLKYPKIIDSLIHHKLITIYSKDSLFKHEILGSMYHPMSLEDCKIDTSIYNVVIKVKTTNKEELWQFEFKKTNHNMKLINFYKNPPIL